MPDMLTFTTSFIFAESFSGLPLPAAYQFDLSDEFVPRGIQLCERLAALVRYRIVFAGRTLRGFLPAVGEEPLVLLARQDGVERTFHDNHPCVFQLCDDFRGVGVAARKYQEDAVLQDALAHLRLYVVYIDGFHGHFLR